MGKIIVADNPLNEMSIAKELLPPGLDAVMAKQGSPEFNDAVPDAVCLVGFGDGSLDDAFYKRASNLKLVRSATTAAPTQPRFPSMRSC